MSRENQRRRTQTALVRAAAELLHEGTTPSMPDIAERALVSLATAYRYFSSAEELCDAASWNIADFDEEALVRALEEAGGDVEARLELVIKGIGWTTIDQDVAARRAVKRSLDSWFAQSRKGQTPALSRPRQRMHWNALALEPLRGRYPDEQIDRLVESLSIVLGVEPVISLRDVIGLSREDAKERMLTTARWILRAGLAEMDDSASPHNAP